MITVKLESNLNRRKVVINGHADFAEAGKDIVCAGVSTLAQTYYSFLKEMESYGRVHICSCHYKGGHFELECIVASGWSMAAYDMFKCGLEGIAEAYPQFVEII